MACQETKNCPRCNARFECRPGNVTECQCWGLQCSEAEKAYISNTYEDCLCRDCLLRIGHEMRQRTATAQMTAILSGIKPE